MRLVAAYSVENGAKQLNIRYAIWNAWTILTNIYFSIIYSDGLNLPKFGYDKVRDMPNLREKYGKGLADIRALGQTGLITVPDSTPCWPDWLQLQHTPPVWLGWPRWYSGSLLRRRSARYTVITTGTMDDVGFGVSGKVSVSGLWFAAEYELYGPWGASFLRIFAAT